MMTFFILFFIVAFSLLAWKKLESAVLLLAVLLPTYLIRFTVGIPTTLLEVMILVIFVIWFIKNRFFLVQRWQTIIKNRKSPKNNRYPFQWTMIIWLLVSLIAVGVADVSLASLGIWRAYFFEPLLLFIVIINTFQTKESIIKLLSALSISVIGIAVFALYQYITGDFISNDFWANAVNRRATSFFPFPNAIGLYIAPIIPLLLGVIGFLGVKAHARKRLILCLLGVILGLLAILSARSEGAFLALLLTLPIFGLLATRLTRCLTMIVIAIGIIFLIVHTPAKTYMIDRLTLQNFSGQVRRLQWKETLKMLNDGRLITGAGLANYQTAVAPYHQEGFFVKNNEPDFDDKIRTSAEFREQRWQPLEIYLYPHNIILNFWSELGLLGLLTFIWIVVTFYYYAWQAYWRAKKVNSPDQFIILGLACSLLVIMIHGLVDVPYFKNDLSVLFWMMMALMGLLYLPTNKNLEKHNL